MSAGSTDAHIRLVARAGSFILCANEEASAILASHLTAIYNTGIGIRVFNRPVGLYLS